MLVPLVGLALRSGYPTAAGGAGRKLLLLGSAALRLASRPAPSQPRPKDSLGSADDVGVGATSVPVARIGADERRQGEPQAYDFRRPNKFSREHIRGLQIVNETFARQFSTVLATTLRAVSSVTLTTIDQQTYDEYIGSLPNPTYLGILSMPPLPGPAMIQIPLPIAMAAVDRLLGGIGDGGEAKRPPTEIEAQLIATVIERALRELAYAFESLMRIDAHIARAEHNPQFAQIGAPSDMVIVISFETKIGSEIGPMSLAMPFDTIVPILDVISSQSIVDRDEVEVVSFHHRLDDALRAVPVDLSVRFGTVALGAREILDLQVGDVIPLAHPINEPVTVMVDGLPFFHAVTGRRGKRLACVVTECIGNEE